MIFISVLSSFFLESLGERRGVGAHPHKGFETVTVAYQGEVEHRDSSGGGGKIGPGDVQWMTAGKGIIHEEFQGLRITPNVYTTLGELDRFCDQMELIARKGLPG